MLRNSPYSFICRGAGQHSHFSNLIFLSLFSIRISLFTYIIDIFVDSVQ